MPSTYSQRKLPDWFNPPNSKVLFKPLREDGRFAIFSRQARTQGKLRIPRAPASNQERLPRVRRRASIREMGTCPGTRNTNSRPSKTSRRNPFPGAAKVLRALNASGTQEVER